LSSGKYYEANLVLKGAEEGIVIDSEMIGAGQ
ncbi:YfdX family protein, partial [Citrobacter freundii]